MTVVAAWVHPGQVDNDFAVSLWRTKDHHPQLVAGILHAQDPELCQARNDNAHGFLEKHSAEWLWSVDTDMAWEPDDLPRLLALADPQERPIIGGWYVSSLRKSTWRTVDERGIQKVLRAPKRSNTVQLAALGMGFTLIHRRVIEDMAEAYRADPWSWFANDVFEIGGKRARMSEDFTFCGRAIRLGFSVWGAGVLLKHRKPQVLV